MSVHRITLTTAEEQYAPPSEEVEVCVIGNRIFLTHYTGSDDNIPSTKKKAYEFPELNLDDLLKAIAAFGDGVQGWRYNAKA